MERGLRRLSGAAPPSALEPTATDALPPDEADPLADWIEVDLARQLIVVHADGGIVASHAASSGRADVAGASTPAGLYRVQTLPYGPIEDVPGILVGDIVIYDA